MILQHKRHIINWMLLHTLTDSTAKINTKRNWREIQRQRWTVLIHKLNWSWESYSILNVVGLMILQHKRHIMDWMLLQTLIDSTAIQRQNWREIQWQRWTAFESCQCSQNNTFVLTITKENKYNIQQNLNDRSYSNTGTFNNTDWRLKPMSVLTIII